MRFIGKIAAAAMATGGLMLAVPAAHADVPGPASDPLDDPVEAAHPLFGKITIRLPDVDVSPDSVLNFGPTGLVQTMLLTFNIMFEKTGDQAGPV